VTFAGSGVTINPTNDLIENGGKTFTITMSPGVIKDTGNNSFAGLSGLTYQFGVLDSTPPTMSTYLPAQGAASQVSATDIVLTFSENIQAATGNVVLTPSGGSGSNIPLNIDVTTGQVVFDGATATINPTDDLKDDAGKTWTVTIASGVLTDAAGNAFTGISGTTYQFSMPDATPPIISLYSPSKNGVPAPLLQHASSAYTDNVVLTFSEVVSAVTGDIVLTPTTGASFTIAANDAQVRVRV